jgi:hypothetical protein
VMKLPVSSALHGEACNTVRSTQDKYRNPNLYLRHLECAHGANSQIKAMCAIPARMHLQHAFLLWRWCRRKVLPAQPEVGSQACQKAAPGEGQVRREAIKAWEGAHSSHSLCL